MTQPDELTAVCQGAVCGGVVMVGAWLGVWRTKLGWPQRLLRFRLWFLAFFRLDLNVVCEMSRGRDLYNDYHDYPDTEDGVPWHMTELKCNRCGKGFCI